MRVTLGGALGVATVAAHAYFLLVVKRHYDAARAGGPAPPDWPDVWIPIFLASIALEAVYLYYTRGQPFRLNDSISSLATGLVMQTSQRQIALLIGFVPYTYVYTHYRVATLPDSWATWLAMFVGVELGYYWLHRTSHTIGAFWASHSVHHSSEEYNLTTALRQSVFMAAFSWAYYLPLALLFHPALFHAHAQFHLLYQYWIHTETIPKLGPLEYVLNTPSQHRVHHGRNPLYVDKNYGGTLCVFDRLFGTFQEELESEAVVYGIIGPLNSFDAVAANTTPYAKVWAKMRAAPSLALALRSLWERPGWQTDGTELHPPPVARLSVRRYDPRLPLSALLYAAVLFALALVLYVAALAPHSPLSAAGRHLVALVIYAAFVGAGAVLDRKPYALTLEAGRALTSAAVLYAVLPAQLFLAATALQAAALGLLLVPARAAFASPVTAAELSSDGPAPKHAATAASRSPTRRRRAKVQ